MAQPYNQRIYGVVLLAAIISCFAAFFNHFPLVYQDTGTYIRTAYENYVPPERPVFYGLFIRYTSFFTSLWLVVIAQGLITCYLVYLTLGLFFEGFKRSYIFIGCITFVTLFTGFSYTISILLPDIFSALSVLCLINILLNKKLNLLQQLFIQALFVLSICTQLSSLAIIGALLGIFVLYALIKKITRKPLAIPISRLFVSVGLFLGCLVLIPSVNYSYDKKFRISDANHVYELNHLLQAGILKEYLEDACVDHSYKLCAYKDSLGTDLVWAADSPVFKTGGWEANKNEYSAILRDVMTRDKYVKKLALKSIEFTLKQFFCFDVTVSPGGLMAAPQGEITWHYSSATWEFMSSIQMAGKPDVTTLNSLQQIVVLTSIVFLCVVLITPYLFKKLSFTLKATLIIFLAHNILNAFVCANLSMVHDRFQNRLAWLFPVLAICIIFQLLEYKRACV